MRQPPIRLKLPPDLKEAISRIEYERIDRAVADRAEYDSRMFEWLDQYDCNTTPSGNQRWANSCELTVPMTFNQCTTVLSQCAPALRREPKVMVESATGDEESSREAEDIEAFITAKGAQIDWTKKLLATIDFALKMPVGIASVYWEEIHHQVRGVQVIDPETGDKLPEEAEPDGEDWERQPYVLPGDLKFQGVEIKPIPLYDFYMYPASSITIGSANGVGERMWLTQDDLIAGIDNYGYDEDSVYQLIDRYPDGICGSQETGLGRQNEYRSIKIEGLYECFLWTFHPPVIMDAGKLDSRIKPYLQDDFEMICCPEARITLRMEYRDDPTGRRYIPFRMLPRGNEFFGICIPEILEDIQCEANANLRYMGDSKDIQIAPMFFVKKGAVNDLQNVKIGPGQFIPVDSPQDCVPVTQQQTWSEGGIWQGWLNQTATEVISAGNFGSSTQKQRKASEIESVDRAAASKFDLYLMNLMDGVMQVAVKMQALYAEFMDDAGETFADETHGIHTVTPQALKGKFIYTPVVNAATASPDTRVRMAEMQHHLASSYLAIKAKMGTPGGPTPEVCNLEWENTRKSLIDMGEHNPESRIGKQPEIPPAQPQGAMPPMGGQPQGQPGQPTQMPPQLMQQIMAQQGQAQPAQG